MFMSFNKSNIWCNGDLWIYTHPQWNLADFLCTDFRVSPVHMTWYQSSQSSHCTQSTSLCLLWGWMQSTEAHVLYIKPSSSWSSPESLVFDVFLAFLCVRMDFLGLLLAVKKKNIMKSLVKGAYKSGQSQTSTKFLNFNCKILILIPKRFCLNCNTTGFCPQTWGLFTWREGYPCAGVTNVP